MHFRDMTTHNLSQKLPWSPDLTSENLGVQPGREWHWIISQGSQANNGGKQSPDRIWGRGCRLGHGCSGEMTLLPSPLMPASSMPRPPYLMPGHQLPSTR